MKRNARKKTIFTPLRKYYRQNKTELVGRVRRFTGELIGAVLVFLIPIILLFLANILRG